MEEIKRTILTLLLVFVAVGTSFILANLWGPERVYEIAETFGNIFIVAGIGAALIFICRALIKRKK